MSFLVILLVLLVDKFSDWRPRLQHDGPWLTRLRQAEANPRLRDAPWLTLLLLVVLPVVLLGLLLEVLEPLAYGWLALPVHLLVLLYSLGRGHARPSSAPSVMPGGAATKKPRHWLPSAMPACARMTRPA